MYKNQKISLLIPSYNEKEGINYILNSIPSFIDEIIIVDSSTDGTGELAKNHGALVITEKHRGYGKAYKTGFNHVTGDIIITMDADGTYPANKEELVKLLDELIDSHVDFISASRFPMKVDRRLMRLRRLIGNKLITLCANILFKANFSDILSGMWIFRRKIIDKLNIISDDWNFSEEIKIEAFINSKIKFKEIKIPYKPRIGESKLLESFFLPYKTGISNILFLFRKRISV